MNRRTLLKAIAATPLAVAVPPVPEAKPEWLNWEGRAGRAHFIHVRVDPEDVERGPVDAKTFASFVRHGLSLPPQWFLRDFTLLGEKFYAALGLVKNPDYSRNILANPVDEGGTWGEMMPGGYYLIRGAEVSTRDAYDWPKGGDGIHPAAVVGNVFFNALWHRSDDLAERTGRRPSWETLHTVAIQVPTVK